MKHGILSALIGLGMTFGLVACGDDGPSCSDAVSSYYSGGCTLISGEGDDFSEAQARAVLCSGGDDVRAAGCGAQYDALVSCLDGANGACESCSGRFDAMNACLAAGM